MSSGQFLLFFIQIVRVIANKEVSSVSLLLKEYIHDLFITSVSIKCVMALFR